MKNRDPVDKVADCIIICAVITVIILKITNVIKISWLWLLSPIWIALAMGIILAIILFSIGFIKVTLENKRRNNYERY